MSEVNNQSYSSAQLQAQEHLSKEGWCVVPDVLDASRTKEILSRLWDAASKSETLGDPTYLPFLDPNSSNVRVFYLLALDSIFRDLIEHPTAIQMVKSLLGEDFLISNFTANIARPGSQSMALHSDQSLVMPDPWNYTWAVNAI